MLRSLKAVLLDIAAPFLSSEIKSVLLEFQCREIQVKDLDRGLVDFPALLSGNEVFLCWELGEDDIGFWHELDAGYAGRERLEPGTE